VKILCELDKNVILPMKQVAGILLGGRPGVELSAADFIGGL
jgi:hypothetical protein